MFKTLWELSNNVGISINEFLASEKRLSKEKKKVYFYVYIILMFFRY